MKKLVLILSVLCSITTVYAQPKTILVYGNFSVNTDHQDYNGFSVESSQWFVNPGVGYQLDKHWTLGIQGSYGENVEPNNTSIEQSVNTTGWTVGVFARYTRNFGNIFSIYGQVDLSNAQGTLDIKEGSTALTPQASYVGFRGSLYPALSANIYKGLALNFSFGGISYSSNSWTNHPSTLTTENKLHIDFGQSLTIGISKNFATGKKMHGHHEPGDETRHMNVKEDEDDDTPAPKAHKESKKHHDKKGKKAGGKAPKKTSDDDDE